MISPRPRPVPERGLAVDESLVEFLRFLNTTAVNKIAGLTESQAMARPISSSPDLSLAGLLKHLTAVQRQHIQIHLGGRCLPALWNSDDHGEEFRLAEQETVASIVAAFDMECETSYRTLSDLDLDAPIETWGAANTAARLLVDVVQECARHVGHMDIVRELIDGATGE